MDHSIEGEQESRSVHLATVFVVAIVVGSESAALDMLMVADNAVMEVEKELVETKVVEWLHLLHLSLSLSDRESSFDFVD